MNAYLSDQPVRLSPLRDEQGNQPRFGLLLEPGRPGMHVGELPAQWLKGLARSHHLLLLRGFAAFADAESLTRYCHDFGEVMLWPFGAVLELVEQEGAEDHIFANNYVPLHWDGMYLETVPEFQVFHCVDAPGDSDGGRTTFSSTPAALQLADSSELELWRRASGRYQRSAAHYSSRSAAPIVERHPRREFPILRFCEPPVEGDASFINPSEFHYDGIAPEQRGELLDSLRDGRQVYLNGERVADVTRHRAFRNACRSIAGLYDGLHGEQRDVLTRVDAQGRRSHRFFTPAQNAEDLLGAREAIGCWSRMTYGFMGRTPDYKAAFMSGLEAGAGFYGDYRQNACAWHRAFADRGLFLNHAIINPPLDRSKAIHEMRDVFVHVERETDQGIVVSGAKMLATGSAITNATFVAPVASAQMEAGKAEDFALVFFARMDNPGLRLMCRPSYEERASSPFDYPLSSRFDENDSVLLFDKALIPWEDVLVYRDLRRATGFYAESGFANLYNFQSGIRLGVKLELMIGLLSLGVRANGTQGFRGIQAALGELIALQHLLQALTTAMARDPERNAAGSAVPRLEYANALRIQVPQIWKRVRELLESALGGAPLVTVSGAADLRDGEARRLVDSYYRGAELEPEQRLKLFKLIWDATGSEFGARHAVYESHYSGNAEQIRLDSLAWASRRGHLAYCEAMVQRCMADYDIHGWLRGPWRHD